MRSPSFSRPPPLLWLLLAPWPVWTTAPSAPAPSGSLGCPEACVCAPGGQANCSALALPAVPAGLNGRVRALLLDHNRVHALPPGAFAGAGALLHLDLRQNGLRSVHARAFWGLVALRRLDLSSNQLEALTPGTFSPLRALRALSLAGNRLARLEPAALGPPPRRHRPPQPPAEAETLLCVFPGRMTLRRLTAFRDAAFSHCARPMAPLDLAVVYALGPVSFLASVAACLALGSVLTLCRCRHHHCRAPSRPVRRPPDPDPEGPGPLSDPGNPSEAAATQV
ncbi:leucine-rich repeat-containing protein 26 [Tupaia chinensis]|uniref:leucine-rich repeat-containing protein 26 n=1 Tax=Tupaia chinensis TaxID=246437 RepID=UPI000703FDE4|nr:leucine-rich repeat-containing protein 26 [Tupaia chinensis]